jgi:type VI secretion system secreted protein Hcp
VALFDAFLKLDGIKGESADDKHKGELDILSFSWGMQQTGSQASGGGGGAGKVRAHDFVMMKHVDAASPLLMLNCANGTHIKEANFVVRKAGGTQLEYLKIKLTDVLVSSYEPHAENGNGAGGHLPAVRNGQEVPTEKFSLNYSKIEFSYQAQGADGKAQGGPVLAGWDVKANKKV